MERPLPSKIMSPEDIKELMQFYAKDFKIKTGRTLVCMERKRKSKGSVKLNKDKVIDIAAEFFAMPHEVITGKSREQNIIQVRQMVTKVFNSLKMNQESIGARLNQDRTTVVNTLYRFKVAYRENKTYKETFDKFRKYCDREMLKDTYYENTGKISGK